MSNQNSGRVPRLGAAAVRGAVAGAVGVLAMTLAEKAEQAVTGRSNSYVPARALRAMAGVDTSELQRPAGTNHLMHWSSGMLLGSLRGVWSAVGIRGVQASATHTVLRLAFDQTLENLSGAGAPPDRWSSFERTIDGGHKAVYSLVTGWVADRWIEPALASSRGRYSH